MIWRLPDGQTYITTPGSALLFPSLCAPTADLSIPDAPPTPHCGERTAKMPKRRRTRAQDRASRVATERHHNRQARLARKPLPRDYFALPPPTGDEEPPPF